ncbi:MAG: Dabb family protein [Acidimicrobiia bacterium]
MRSPRSCAPSRPGSSPAPRSPSTAGPREVSCDPTRRAVDVRARDDAGTGRRGDRRALGPPGADSSDQEVRGRPDLGLAADTASFGIVPEFETRADYEAYRDHPAHQQVIAEHIAPIRVARAAIQFEH